MFEANAALQLVTVNGHALRKGERVALSDGDELAFEYPGGKKRCDYLYQQLAVPPQLAVHPCPSSAAPSPAAPSSEKPRLPKMPIAHLPPTHHLVHAMQPPPLPVAPQAAPMPPHYAPRAKGTLELRLNDQHIASVDLGAASHSKNPLPNFAAMVEAQAQMRERGERGFVDQAFDALNEYFATTSAETPPVPQHSHLMPAPPGVPQPTMHEIFRMLGPRGGVSAAPTLPEAVVPPPGPDAVADFLEASDPIGAATATPIAPADVSAEAVPSFSLAVSPALPVDQHRDALTAQFRAHLSNATIPPMFQSHADISVTLEKFPYIFNESLKQVLLNATHLFLQQDEDLATKHVPESVKSISRRILLLGQHGTELYQDSVVQAIAKHYAATLVSFEECAFANAEKSWNEMKGAKCAAAGFSRPNPISTEMEVAVTPATCAEAAPFASHFADSMDVEQQSVSFTVVPQKPPNMASSPTTLPVSIAPSPSLPAAATASAPSFKVGDRVRYVGGHQSGTDLERLFKFFVGSSGSKNSSSSQPSQITLLQPPNAEGASGLPGIAILRRQSAVAQAAASGPPNQSERSPSEKHPRHPPHGSVGTVVLPLGSKRIGVKFDQTWSGAIPLPQVTEEKLGCFCAPSDLSPEIDTILEYDIQLLDALFEKIEGQLRTGAKVVLHVKKFEKLLLHHFNRFVRFKNLIDGLKGQIVVFAGACSSSVGGGTTSGSSEKDSHRSGSGIMMYARAAPSGMDVFDQLSNQIRGVLGGSGADLSASSMASKLVNVVFPNKIVIHPPESTSQMIEWEKRLEQDVRKSRSDQNIVSLRAVLQKHGFDAVSINSKPMSEKLFSSEGLEKIAGFAISDHVMNCTKAHQVPSVGPSGKIELSAPSVDAAVQMLRHSKPHKKRSVLDTATENSFEKQLLGDVIPPSDIGVRFEDIGALDKVKDTLRELVMLPLQRPELFRRGNLAKPCKGILLFGPPGTGKTVRLRGVSTPPISLTPFFLIRCLPRRLPRSQVQTLSILAWPPSAPNGLVRVRSTRELFSRSRPSLRLQLSL